MVIKFIVGKLIKKALHFGNKDVLSFVFDFAREEIGESFDEMLEEVGGVKKAAGDLKHATKVFLSKLGENLAEELVEHLPVVGELLAEKLNLTQSECDECGEVK